MNIHDFSLLDDDEYNRTIFEWNRTEHEYPCDKTVAELFEAVVEKTKSLFGKMRKFIFG